MKRLRIGPIAGRVLRGPNLLEAEGPEVFKIWSCRAARERARPDTVG